jgi:hypothetical protein
MSHMIMRLPAGAVPVFVGVAAAQSQLPAMEVARGVTASCNTNPRGRLDSEVDFAIDAFGRHRPAVGDLRGAGAGAGVLG